VAAAPDGRIFVIGGTTNGSGNGATNVVLAYLPSANRWMAVSSLAQNRYGLAAAVGPEGRVHAIGGFENGNYSKRLEVYGPFVTLQPQMGVAGSMSAISGNNFAANARVTVRFNNVVVGTGMTDGSGALGGVTFQVPAIGAGLYAVTAVDHKSLYPVTIPFQVN
jgi:hypothetical protein